MVMAAVVLLIVGIGMYLATKYFSTFHVICYVNCLSCNVYIQEKVCLGICGYLCLMKIKSGPFTHEHVRVVGPQELLLSSHTHIQ
jgi:hypothetical protein